MIHLHILIMIPSDHPTPRQGGDTDVDATVIEALPFVMAGTTDWIY